MQKEGTLYIPEHIKKENTPKPSCGIVVAVGEEHDLVTHQPLKEGDGVMFSKYAGMDFMIEAENFRIVSVDDILCTFVDTESVVTEVK